MEASMEALTIQSRRPDIQEATDTPAEIKSKLVYRDHDELDTGMQKVQPLPFLDEEIQKHYEVINDSLQPAQEVKDPVPAQVFQQVQTVMKEANDGKTTLFKASDLLEFTSEAYLYARTASRDTFDLERTSQRELSRYDEVFKRMIQNRIGAKMEDADTDMEECRSLLDSAVVMADGDCENLKQRTVNEDAVISMDMLKETHTATQDSIRDEKGELEMIKEQCVTDISTIASELDKFNRKMNTTEQDYQQYAQRCGTELNKNRSRQRELEAELAQLRAAEKKLEADLQSGGGMQDEASRVREKALGEMRGWSGKIEELQRRTQTALSVMDHMEECTDLIMRDAKEKKQQWKKRLSQLEEESLLSLRDSLMAQGVLFTMIDKESKINSDEVTKELKQMEKDKGNAARNGFRMKVKDLNDKIGGYTEQQKLFEDKIAEMKQLLTDVRERVKEVDTRLKQLHPSIKLDTLDSRYAQNKKALEQAFTKGSVEGIQLSSHGKYN